jgi:hypothetical protein
MYQKISDFTNIYIIPNPARCESIDLTRGRCDRVLVIQQGLLIYDGSPNILAIVLPTHLFNRLTPQRCDRVDRCYPLLI